MTETKTVKVALRFVFHLEFKAEKSIIIVQKNPIFFLFMRMRVCFGLILLFASRGPSQTFPSIIPPPLSPSKMSGGRREKGKDADRDVGVGADGQYPF